MATEDSTSHRLLSMTVGLAIAMVAGALALVGCATSPEPTEKKTEPPIAKAEKPERAEKTGEAAPPTVEKPAPSESAGGTTEKGAEKAPGSEKTASKPAAAPPAYPGTAEHIQEIEERLKPLRSVPSKPEG